MTKTFSRVLVHNLPATLVLQAGLGQVDGEHAGDPHHACDPSVDQLGRETVGRQILYHQKLKNNQQKDTQRTNRQMGRIP